MKLTTEQQRKDELIRRILQVKDETELIIANPQLIEKENRINGDIKAYTNECPICNLKSLTGCEGCVFGVKKSCLKTFWHPKKDAEKKDFQRALAFLEFILPHLKSLPDFVFSEGYVTALREHIGSLDHIFKEDFQSHKNKKYKSEYFRQKDKTSVV